MLYTLLAILALAALAIGSYTDMKKREVPDWISYSLIAGALGIRLLYSLFSKKPGVIIYGLAGFALFFILSHIMYYLKQWGGGDAKLLMGLGAVFGLNVFEIESYKAIGMFLLLLILFGAVCGLLYSIYLAVKNKTAFMKSFRENIKEFDALARFASVLLILSLAGLLAIDDFVLAFLIFGVAVIFFIGIFAFLLTRSVEQSCLFQKVKASQLTEGDWVVQTIRYKGKTVIKKDNLGITKEQIMALKGYKSLILVKLGIPFIPAFLLAYIALTWFKEAILSIFSI